MREDHDHHRMDDDGAPPLEAHFVSRPRFLNARHFAQHAREWLARPDGTAFGLRQLQREQAAWARYNFPGKPGKTDEDRASDTLHGVTEELGELSHGFLKMRQGIRGTREEHMAKIKDAIGDILVYLADFCTRLGIDFQECAQGAWDEVRHRDWARFPRNGETE